MRVCACACVRACLRACVQVGDWCVCVLCVRACVLTKLHTDDTIARKRRILWCGTQYRVGSINGTYKLAGSGVCKCKIREPQRWMQMEDFDKPQHCRGFKFDG